MATCKEEGCKVLSTGKCINSLDINICPHYADEETSDKDEEPKEDYGDLEELDLQYMKSEIKEVYSGRALSIEDANLLARCSLTRLIVLAGMPHSGKTTLPLSLMQFFATQANFEGYLFAGSKTLIEFEEKSHQSKAVSERKNPETSRTPIGQPLFLHLKVSDKNNCYKSVDLLFTDISGETFMGLKDSTDLAKSFTLGLRADHFVLFFDSERIINIQERANTRASGLGILKSLSEAGTLLFYTNIQIVFSRWDLYLEKSEKDKVGHDEFIEVLKQEIIKQFGHKFNNIEFFEVAARPEKKLLDFGYGINKIFNVWVNKSILDEGGTIKPVEKGEHSRHYLNYKFNN